MKKIKLFSLVLLISISFNTYSQSDFCKGWREGYIEGYCYKKVGCVSPVAPACPVNDIGESTHKDGYLRGFKLGMSNNEKSNSIGLQPNRSNGIGKMAQEQIRYEKENNSQRKPKNKIKFDEAIEKTLKYLEQKNYDKCVSTYEEVKNLGYSDDTFEFMVSGCYYALWSKYDTIHYFNKSIELLNLSAKNGNQNAKNQLEKFNNNFNSKILNLDFLEQISTVSFEKIDELMINGFGYEKIENEDKDKSKLKEFIKFDKKNIGDYISIKILFSKDFEKNALDIRIGENYSLKKIKDDLSERGYLYDGIKNGLTFYKKEKALFLMANEPNEYGITQLLLTYIK